MLNSFERYNTESKDNRSKIIGSMDATNLFPSIKPDKAAEIVKETILNSKIQYDGLDVVELGKYLRENMDSDTIKDNNWDEILPKKEKKSKSDGNNRKPKDKNIIIDITAIEDIRHLFDPTDDPTSKGEANCLNCDHKCNKIYEKSVHMKKVHMKSDRNCKNCDCQLRCFGEKSTHKKKDHVRSGEKCKSCDHQVKTFDEKPVQTDQIHEDSGKICKNCDYQGRNFDKKSVTFSLNNELRSDSTSKGGGNCKSCDHQVRKSDEKPVHMEKDHEKSGENCKSCDNENAQNNQHENPYKGWTCPMRQPTKSEEKKMFVESICILIKVLMNNHAHTFNGKV